MFTISYETLVSDKTTSKVINRQVGKTLEIVHQEGVDIFLLDGSEVCTSQELIRVRVTGFEFKVYKN